MSTETINANAAYATGCRAEQIPRFVRAYGMLFMVMGEVTIAGMILILLIALGQRGWIANLPPYATVQLFMGAAAFLLGKALKAGRRLAVYCLCAFAATVGLIAVKMLTAGEGMFPALVLFWAFFFFYLPPLVSAFRHWSAFR